MEVSDTRLEAVAEAMKSDKLKVHPVAARYPMLPDDEITELAADIHLHGLIHPIVIDGDVLIDGRNRLKACLLADVEPTFRQFPWNGEGDKEAAVTAYIVGENIRRRHLNAGQRAILVAIAYPEPDKTGPRIGLETKPTDAVNKGTLSQARAIVKWCPEYVEDILAGVQVFAKAFEEADRRREKAAVVAAQLKRLQAEAPDLHAFVLEQKGMTAAEAIAALDARIKAKAEEERQAAEAKAAAERAEEERRAAELDERQRRERAETARLKAEREQRTLVLQRALTMFNPRGTDPRAYAQRLFADIDLALWPQEAGHEASIECWAEVARTLAELVQVRKDSLP